MSGRCALMYQAGALYQTPGGADGVPGDEADTPLGLKVVVTRNTEGLSWRPGSAVGSTMCSSSLQLVGRRAGPVGRQDRTE